MKQASIYRVSQYPVTDSDTQCYYSDRSKRLQQKPPNTIAKYASPKKFRERCKEPSNDDVNFPSTCLNIPITKSGAPKRAK